MWVHVLGVVCVLVIGLLIKLKRATRVPECLKDLPELPPIGAPAAVRLAAVKEIAKKHPLARQWFFYRWSVVLLDPDASKELYANQNIYQKFGVIRAFPYSFATKFFGKENLLSARGEVWKRHRNVANPVFEITMIRKFESLFTHKAEELLGEFAKEVGKPIKIQDYMQRFTLDCMGITCFDVDFHSVTDPKAVYPTLYHRIIKELMRPARNAIPLKLYDLMPLPSNRQLAKDIAQFNTLMTQVLDKKRTTTEERERIDLASQFIAAQANEEHLSTEEVRSNMAIFFLAGHDTTATSLASALYHLAAHPQIQDKFHEELVHALRGDSGEIDLKAPLDLVTAVIQESTRMVPPVARLSRLTSEPTTLAGHDLPKDTLVFVSIEGIQSLEREWRDPEKFDPSRFLKDGETDVTRRALAWQPFGNGPRMCIGRNFSVLEQKILLAKVVLKYQLSLPDTDPGRVEISETAGLNKVVNEIIIKPRSS